VRISQRDSAESTKKMHLTQRCPSPKTTTKTTTKSTTNGTTNG
jgi:hypothetical protein